MKGMYSRSYIYENSEPESGHTYNIGSLITDSWVLLKINHIRRRNFLPRFFFENLDISISG